MIHPKKSFMVHLPNKTVKFVNNFDRVYYQKPKYITNNNKDKTKVNHTIIPTTSPTKNFVHVMITGVDDNINFAGVATNNTNRNDTNQSELATISKDKPSKTLVEFIDNNTCCNVPYSLVLASFPHRSTCSCCQPLLLYLL
jgi:hypothetical protein